MNEVRKSFVRIFDIRGRIGRVDYLCSIIMSFFACALLLLFWVCVGLFFQLFFQIKECPYVLGLCYLLMGWAIRFMTIVPTIKRLHDLNLSGYWLVGLFLVDIVQVVFRVLFVPRTKPWLMETQTPVECLVECLVEGVFIICHLALACALFFAPGYNGVNKYDWRPVPQESKDGVAAAGQK